MGLRQGYGYGQGDRIILKIVALIGFRGLMLQAVFKKHNSLLRPLKKKGFKEERVTTIGLYDLGKSHDPGIQQEPAQITQLAQQSEVCQRLTAVGGVGPLTATAFVAAVHDPGAFKNGRHCAAWLGLVPTQHGTGGKTVLGGVSKRGNQYLRRLLLQGAMAVLRRLEGKTDTRSVWLQQLRARRGTQVATVALANKNARVLWALLATGEVYRQAA
jgi:transposase